MDRELLNLQGLFSRCTMFRKRFITTFYSLVFLFLGLVFPLAGETYNFTDGVYKILQLNPDIEAASWDVIDARNNISPFLQLENSKFSVGLSQRGTFLESEEAGAPSQNQASNDVQTSVDLSVPIIPQVSFGTSLNQDMEGSVSVSLSPFAESGSSPKETETLKKAEAKLEDLQRTIGYQIETTLLQNQLAQMQLEYAITDEDLARRNYTVQKQAYELDEITFDDLQDEADQLSQKKKIFFTNQKKAIEAERNQKLLFSEKGDEIIIEPLSQDNLDLLLEKRIGEMNDIQGNQAYSLAMVNTSYELDSLEQQYGATWFWRPSLSIKGSIDYPNSDYLISGSISFSLNDLKHDERKELARDIANKRDSLMEEAYLLELDVELQEKSININRESYESAKQNLVEAELLHREAEFLFQEGERTVLELEAAGLSVNQAKITLFSSGIDLLGSLNDYLSLFR